MSNTVSWEVSELRIPNTLRKSQLHIPNTVSWEVSELHIPNMAKSHSCIYPIQCPGRSQSYIYPVWLVAVACTQYSVLGDFRAAYTQYGQKESQLQKPNTAS